MGAAKTLATHTGWTTYENRHDMSHAEEYLHDDIVINQSGAEGVRRIVVYRAMMEAQYGAFPDRHAVRDGSIRHRTILGGIAPKARTACGTAR